MQQGIAIEKAREIVKLIKDSKKKVQASIQGDLVRVSGKDRDTLQEIIALLRSRDFGIDHAVYELPVELKANSPQRHRVTEESQTGSGSFSRCSL